MINKKTIEKIVSRKLLLIGIILIISLIYLVSALTFDERQSLNDELNNLTAGLGNQGYFWLTDYNMKIGGNI